jgi:hypothetical protein
MVRGQLMGAVQAYASTIELPSVLFNPGEDQLHHRVVGIQCLGPDCVVVGELFSLLKAIPDLTAPLVEVGQRESPQRPRVMRIAREGPLKKLASLFVRFRSQGSISVKSPCLNSEYGDDLATINPSDDQRSLPRACAAGCVDERR